MDRDLPGPMTPFDELVTTPELQMIKLLLPYTPASGRQTLAALVKCRELDQAVRLFRQGNNPAAQTLRECRPESPDDLLDCLRPYLTPQQASALDTISQIREMMPLIEILRASQTATGSASDEHCIGFNFTDLLSGMLTPEQQELFAEYSELFSQEQKNEKKGDRSDGQ